MLSPSFIVYGIRLSTVYRLYRVESIFHLRMILKSILSASEFYVYSHFSPAIAVYYL